MIMRSSIKKGKDNVAADALSRKYKDGGYLFALSSPIPEWIEEACQEWLAHDSTARLVNTWTSAHLGARLHGAQPELTK